MEKDFTVRVEVKQRDSDQTKIEVFRFGDYVYHDSQSIKQMLFEFERIINRLENTTDKSEWSEETQSEYAAVRRRALNISNSIARLPQTLCYKGIPCNSIAANELFAQIIDRT